MRVPIPPIPCRHPSRGIAAAFGVGFAVAAALVVSLPLGAAGLRLELPSRAAPACAWLWADAGDRLLVDVSSLTRRPTTRPTTTAAGKRRAGTTGGRPGDDALAGADAEWLRFRVSVDDPSGEPVPLPGRPQPPGGQIDWDGSVVARLAGDHRICAEAVRGQDWVEWPAPGSNGVTTAPAVDFDVLRLPAPSVRAAEAAAAAATASAGSSAGAIPLVSAADVDAAVRGPAARVVALSTAARRLDEAWARSEAAAGASAGRAVAAVVGRTAAVAACLALQAWSVRAMFRRRRGLLGEAAAVAAAAGARIEGAREEKERLRRSQREAAGAAGGSRWGSQSGGGGAAGWGSAASVGALGGGGFGSDWRPSHHGRRGADGRPPSRPRRRRGGGRGRGAAPASGPGRGRTRGADRSAPRRRLLLRCRHRPWGGDSGSGPGPGPDPAPCRGASGGGRG